MQNLSVFKARSQYFLACSTAFPAAASFDFHDTDWFSNELFYRFLAYTFVFSVKSCKLLAEFLECDVTDGDWL